MATLVKALRRRDDEKNPPANPPALNEIIGYVGEAVNNVPHNCAAIGVGLTAANLANASENARLAGDINAALDPFTPLANDESCKRIMIKLGQP